jgi:hypothetical protein
MASSECQAVAQVAVLLHASYTSVEIWCEWQTDGLGKTILFRLFGKVACRSPLGEDGEWKKTGKCTGGYTVQDSSLERFLVEIPTSFAGMAYVAFMDVESSQEVWSVKLDHLWAYWVVASDLSDTE